MALPTVVPGDAPPEPDIDEAGVDRAQIRAMLDLTPEERLLRVQEFVESIHEIRGLNEERPLIKRRSGRPKDIAVIPVLEATLDESKRRS